MPRTSTPRLSWLQSRVSRIEVIAATFVVVVLAGLVALEPDILRAPVQNGRTIAFTFGGAVVAAGAWVAMVRVKVPAAVRVLALGLPFVLVSAWLIEPYFVDDVVDDDFAVSIADAAQTTPPPQIATASSVPASPPSTTAPPAGPGAPVVPSSTTSPAPPPSTASPLPVLVGTGSFSGLAGHEGSGDAGFFRQPDGSYVLRFENFDIDNGPDLRLYVVPGTDQVSPADGALYLGELRGNVGDQTYVLPPDFTPAGDLTVLVWCEAFSVEFVAANVTVA